jgi:transcriptional regulator with XRE-family HTH domain
MSYSLSWTKEQLMYRDEVIRAIKAAKGLTNQEICDGAGVSPMTLGKILAGKRNIEMISLEKVADFLEIPYEDLFGSKKIESVV